MENRDTFLERLHTPPGNVIFSVTEIARIELAYDQAKYAHRAQERKDGTRYFEHPRKVALLLLDAIGLYDAAAVIAALLHDAYEDSPKYVTPEKIGVIGGEEASRMVRFLSKVPKDGYLDRLALAGWKTLVVKLCDRYDNFSDLDGTSEEFQRKQTIETRDVYLPIFAALPKSVPSEYRIRTGRMVASLTWCADQRALKLGLDTPPAPQG